MTIQKSIKNSIKAYLDDDFEGALIRVLIALDATAKKEGIGGGNAERCKVFIKNNRDLITRVGFGIWEFRGEVQLTFKGENGINTVKSLEEIFYHILRCTLLHEDKIPETIRFVKDIQIGSSEDGKIILPERMLLGLIMGVISSPANKDERFTSNLSINIGNNQYLLNKLWGKKDKILKIFRDEADAMDKKSAA